MKIRPTTQPVDLKRPMACRLRDPWAGGAEAREAERGATLIEALITLLVMSIGLLGMPALQLVGIQENASAFRHSQAIWFAYDMADRMRANPAGIAADSYDSVDTGATTPSAQSCTSACTPARARNWTRSPTGCFPSHE